MLGTIAFFLAVTATDPRPALVELQLEDRPRAALDVIEQESQARPGPSQRLGLDYLRGHLLELLGDLSGARSAFAAAMNTTPALNLYSRYRLALEEQQQHPEVAAGLIATVASESPPGSPLLPEAVQILARTLAQGGDCRLLRGLRAEALPSPERRALLLSQADCALRADLRELARSILVRLLEESDEDDTAREAAERLSGLASTSERGRVPMLLGLTFHQHRDFERALQNLRRALGWRGLSERESFETRYALGRSQLWQKHYAQAEATFGALAAGRARASEQRARALYQQGRAYELDGKWQDAVASFRNAYEAWPTSPEWAPASLAAAMRLDWRLGHEGPALENYQTLAARREWTQPAARAALFLAASDLVRGRADRARGWLGQASLDRSSRLEVSYWRGRLAELGSDPDAAVSSYLQVLRADAYHPLARAALRHLGSEDLTVARQAEARRRLDLGGIDNLRDAWLLLGDGDPMGRKAGAKLRQLLLSDVHTGPYLRLAAIPVDRWPLWKAELRRPEEMLLALGIWHEGGPVVATYFPTRDPSLAFTGSLHLAEAGEFARSIRLAEELRRRTPDRIPLALQPRELRQALYPLVYRELLIAQGRARGVDPDLLAAVIRARSRFDPLSLSTTAGRGLTQLPLPVARPLARQLGFTDFDPEELYRPEVAVSLGSAHLASLFQTFGGAPYVALAAYDAGETQALIWRSYCNSLEGEEYFTKITSSDTRRYLQDVLSGWVQYQELY